MKTNCVVMIDTTQPQHTGGQQCAAIGGLLSFPDLKLPTGERNSPRIKLMVCGGLLQTTALPCEASHQSNAVRRGNSQTRSSRLAGASFRWQCIQTLAGLATGHRR